MSYVLANLIHEGLGHGIACWIVSGKARLWTATAFDCDCAGLPLWKFRIVSAAGASANLVAAAGFYAALRRLQTSVRLRYFFWLSAAVNVFQFGGYLMFLYPLGRGDGEAFADSAAVTKWGFFALGFSAYLAGIILTRRTIEPFLRGGGRRKSIHLLTMLPYVSGGMVVCIGSLFNPAGLHPALDYAAASTFIGTFGILQLYVSPVADTKDVIGPNPRESAVWIFGGVLLLVAYVGLFGSGLALGSPH
jgi:hypothetical protein